MSDGISDMLRGPSDYCSHGRVVEDGESCFNCDAELSKVNLQLLARIAELEAQLAEMESVASLAKEGMLDAERERDRLRPIARAAVLETEAQDERELAIVAGKTSKLDWARYPLAREARSAAVNALSEDERAELLGEDGHDQPL